jgi:hypothetical protein
MAVKEIIYKKNLVANTERGPSEVIWADCPWEQINANPVYGYTFFDDFTVLGNAVMSSAYQGSIGQWSVYAGAGATLGDAQLEGGVVELIPGASGKQIALQGPAGALRMLTTSTLALNQKLWFEARVARSTITSAHMEFFVGLMKPTLSSGLPAVNQPIQTTDTLMTAGDLFGFHSDGTSTTTPHFGPTDISVAFELASGTVNYPTNLNSLATTALGAALTAAQYVKIGFIFDPLAQYASVVTASARQTAGNLRRKLIRVFINGVELAGFLSSDDVVNATATQAFPTAFMCPVIAVWGQGSVGASDYLAADWIRVAQLANS